MLAAALREGFRGPLFIQGDHFQVNAKKYAVDPAHGSRRGEAARARGDRRGLLQHRHRHLDARRSLASRTLAEQQRVNFEQCCRASRRSFAVCSPKASRSRSAARSAKWEPRTARVEELRAYMDGFNATLAKQAPGTEGLSKISVQSGTSHGGVVLARRLDRRREDRFRHASQLSKIAREEYGLAGAVQHGASTLPDDRVPQVPADGNLRDPSRDELPEHAVRSHAASRCAARYTRGSRENAKDERKATDTDEQFFYKTRKKAIGPFKRTHLGHAGESTKTTLAAAYDEKFEFLFHQLDIGRHALARRAAYVKPSCSTGRMPHRRSGDG